jgi:hypothetical protein
MAGPLCITHLVVVVVRWFAYVVPSMCHQIIQASLACCYDLFLLTFFLSFFLSFLPCLLQWVVVEWLLDLMSIHSLMQLIMKDPWRPWWDALNEEPVSCYPTLLLAWKCYSPLLSLEGPFCWPCLLRQRILCLDSL